MYVKVRVYAGVKKEKVLRKSDTAFEIHTKEPAEQNRANHRVTELLATEFGCSEKQVRMISGHHSPSKLFDIRK